MKPNLLVVIAALLVTLALMLWHGCRNTSQNDVPHDQTWKPTVSPTSNGSEHAKPPTPEDRDTIVRQKCIEAADRNNVPIAFFGRVIDQDGKPIPGAAVEYTVTAIPMIPVPWGPDKREKGSCVTNEDGLFSVNDKRGTGLYVTEISKEGYRKSGFYRQAHNHYDSFSEDRHIPDRNKPIEFMMIRDDLPRAEKVLEKRIRFAWNKEPITVNLGPDLGSLALSATRSGFDPNNRNNSFDWTVKMRFNGIGVSLLQGESARLAPSEGYAPGHTYEFPKNRNGWKARIEGSRFAILTNNRRFGEMTIDINADGPEDASSCWITIYLNTSGERNIDHK